jgi:hypothetical protein
MTWRLITYGDPIGSIFDGQGAGNRDGRFTQIEKSMFSASPMPTMLCRDKPSLAPASSPVALLTPAEHHNCALLK